MGSKAESLATLNRFKEGFYLREFADYTTRGLVDRVGLQELGIPVVNTPMAGLKDLSYLRRFFVQAKMGFRICFAKKGAVVGIDEEKLLKATTPEDVRDLIGEFVPENRLYHSDQQPFLPVMVQILTTLVVLKQMHAVSLKSIGSPYATRLAGSADHKTVWSSTITAENVWFRIHQLEKWLLDAAGAKGHISDPKELLRTTHFFAQAERLTDRVFGDIFRKHASIAFGI